jgi:hypothetical protein
MQEVRIHDDELNIAKYRDELMGVLPSSRECGNGNVAGFIGEILVQKHIGGVIVDTYDYDILLGDTRIDVKTKSVSSVPQPHYLCSVMEYQLKNDTDAYFFVRVNLSTKKAWLLGSISKARLLRDGISQKRGDMDGTWEVKEDCISVRIDQLEQLVVDEREKF